MAKRYMKTVTVRKMQTKTTIRYNLTTAKMAGGFFNVTEDAQKLEPLHTVSGNTKCSHCGK